MKDKKFLLSFIVLIILTGSIRLQSLAQQEVKSACSLSADFLFCAGKLNTGGNYGYSLAQLNGNCKIVASGTTSNYGAGGYDILLVGVDTNGNYSWAKTIGGNGDDMNGQIVKTRDGGYVLAGSTKSWGTISNADVLLMKLNSSDNIVWTKVFGSATIDESVVALASSADSGYLVLCQNFNNYDGLLYKTDSSGTILWAKHLGSDTTVMTHSDYFQDMKATADGGCIITGWSWSYRLPGAASRQEIVEKFSSAGTLDWARIIGYGQNGLGGLDGHSVTQTSSGAYVIGGAATNCILVKISTTGNLVWSKETDHLIYPNRILTTSDEGLFISGVSLYWHPNNKISRTFFKTDSSTNIVWTRTDDILDGHPNPWDNGGFAIEVPYGFLTIANTHKHTIAYAQTNLCIEKFRTNGFTCYSDSVTANLANDTVLATDITSLVLVYLKNLSFVTTSPTVTPVSQTIDNWTDCSVPVGTDHAFSLNEDDVHIFQNTNTTLIVTSTLSIEQIKIYDLTGKQILQSSYGNQENQRTVQLNIASLPAGIYLASVIDKGGNISNKKFVKL